MTTTAAGQAASHRPNPHSLLRPRGTAVAGMLLETLARNGVDRLWFCSGSELVPLQEAAARARHHGIAVPQLAMTVHEHVAISAAMGESMVTGRPAAVVAHADLGPLNFGAELHTALRGQYPLVLISGYPATHPQRRTSQAFWNQQRWDQGGLFRQYTKWDYKLASYDDVGLVLARAMQVALTPPRGPVYLAVPAEVLAQDLAEGLVTGVDQLAVPRLGEGDGEGIREIARRILAARRPLILTDRVGTDAAAVAALDELAAEFAVSVVATRHRMNLRDDHRSRWGAPRLDEADTVLVLDHSLPWIPADRAPAAGTWIAFVGVDPICAQIPLYEFPADLRLFADLSAFLPALLEELRRQRTASAAERIAVRAEQHERARVRGFADRARAVSEAMAGPVITPTVLGAALNEITEPEDIFVEELGDTAGLVHRSVAGTLFMNGGSSLGWATSGAMGARLASGDRPTVCATGDGGYLFGVANAALWTQSRMDAPVLTVIANNRGYRTGTSHVDSYYPDGYASRAGDYNGGSIDPPPDYGAEARAAGAFGARATTPAELREALRAARDAVERRRVPAVVDAWMPNHLGHLEAASTDAHGGGTR
ncbi:thiamine pyrophosphate-requiring protein [Dactylosporangium sucinum]|uniref:Acetolactate synthase n=1 Tax=Dactylosporangium sucinum TaxID=1424081 RepID=A0A917TZI0_9ACTN|nr:thiamine pyrophosphate-requiring protein [Dactylosporangium sucinum]GGM45960.1 acetolactate synthase [Dactylosporangium sucinum]